MILAQRRHLIFYTKFCSQAVLGNSAEKLPMTDRSFFALLLFLVHTQKPACPHPPWPLGPFLQPQPWCVLSCLPVNQGWLNKADSLSLCPFMCFFLRSGISPSASCLPGKLVRVLQSQHLPPHSLGSFSSFIHSALFTLAQHYILLQHVHFSY